ncbi:hypothetical protein [Natronomonas salsuginis]|jgi:hypothetical protein|uniref:Uncharacterized protein n=1 Tax=Natronomonas salsuginis TaxID=2217661 RepID=A0A4V5ZPB3_9EURY|nr:hypothetical protein [Natronomonas salsuginis]TKR28073.1 hypothetical protein DM868_03030 [Natronomonas salsuginis]
MSSRKSFAVVLFAVLLCSALFAGPAAAVQSEPTDLPEESEVGSDFEATFEVTELFDEFERWTLVSSTELENATWTIRQYNQADDELSREDIDGQNATQSVDIDDGTARIEVRVTGTTPEIENFSYDPPDRFTAAAFTLEREGGTEQPVDSHESHHFTQESDDARNAIDNARDAVEGSGSDEAQSSLDSSISAYESGNFENAINNAERAQGEASQSQLVRNALLGLGAVIVLALLLGGGYWVYKSRQQGPSRLR